MLGDTVVAVASPPGAAERGVLRVSGPGAFAAAEAVTSEPLLRTRGACERRIGLLGQSVPAWILTMPGPRSYTGEDVVELHLPGSPLLLALVAEAMQPHARAATPGEFTRRAYENGRLDLLGAEAVLGLIHAATDQERRQAFAALAGGLPQQIEALRGIVLDALARIEGGLDFEAIETGAVAPQDWLPSVQRALAEASQLEEGQAPAFGASGFLLCGAASAGKSSLCNALAGRQVVLVDPAPGTTRDVITVDAGDGIRLWDAPGVEPRCELGGALRDRLAARALAVLLVVDPTRLVVPPTPQPPLAVVLTHADLGTPDPAGLPQAPRFQVSNVTGQGLPELRAFLAEHARSGPSPRGRHAALLGECRDRLQAAMRVGEEDRGDELAAFELRAALAALDEISGRSTPEDVLDRIFARFCLGK